MTIRPARPSDTAALAELAGALGYPSTLDQVRARLESLLGEDDHAVMVAESEGGAIDGWVHVHAAHTLESDPFAEIGGLVVREGRRGRGTGKVLVGAALDWAARNGYDLIRVRSNVTRVDAHGFYAHLGFEIFKTQLVLARHAPRTGVAGARVPSPKSG